MADLFADVVEDGAADHGVAPGGTGAPAEDFAPESTGNGQQRGGASSLGGAGGARESEFLEEFDHGVGAEVAANSTNEDVANLIHALWNEKTCPEILPYEADIVGDMQVLLNHQVS